MQTSDEDLSGTTIDHYRLIRKVGSGTMGNVYEAKHVELGTYVGLKVLHPRHQGSEAAARFLREGKTLALFQHRNIVELLEVGRGKDDQHYLATELVRGVSLRAVIADGVVEPIRALSIMRQVLDALGAAHALGVVHRDVKPDNIMLADGGSEDGTDLVKVFDFGVAKLLGDTAQILGEANLTQMHMSVFGTPDYIAPETVLGQPIDARTDLYSAGIVLFELLTGRTPFDADDPEALLRLHIATERPTLAQRAPDRVFTPQLELLMSEAIARSPDQRFRSAAEMITAIDAALLSLTETLPPRHAEASGSFAWTQRPATPPPDVPLVASRVPRSESPIWQRALALARTHRMIVGAAAGTLLAVIVLAVVLTGGRPKSAAAHGGKGPNAYLALGHEAMAAGRRIDALSAYERALRFSPSLSTNPELRANVAHALDGKDAVAGVIALELLATDIEPPARDEIVAYASRGKLGEVRRRAVAIAERDGFADGIDRVESWSLDLQQASSCEARRAAIDKLAESNDKRAIAALRRARSHKCVEQAATQAIARIESGG